MKLGEVTEAIEKIWPLQQAEAWDNPGLALGNQNIEVSKVLLTVDVSPEVIREAVDFGAEFILSHHPVIFRPIETLAGYGATQVVLDAAIRAGVSLYSAHTNADHVKGGVSETFANALGLTNLKPLDTSTGHGRIGELKSQLTLGDLAQQLVEILPTTAFGVLVQGHRDMPVNKVALLAGSGDSFLDVAANSEADVYITADLRHHRALDFSIAGKARPMALISVSHWATESLWLRKCAEVLSLAMPGIQFSISRINTDPWDFSI